MERPNRLSKPKEFFKKVDSEDMHYGYGQEYDLKNIQSVAYSIISRNTHIDGCEIKTSIIPLGGNLKVKVEWTWKNPSYEYEMEEYNKNQKAIKAYEEMKRQENIDNKRKNQEELESRLKNKEEVEVAKMLQQAVNRSKSIKDCDVYSIFNKVIAQEGNNNLGKIS